MAKRAIALHDKRTLHVYSSSPQDLKSWLTEFSWVSSVSFVEIRQRLLSDNPELLLIDMRRNPHEALLQVRYLNKHFSNVVMLVLIDEAQLYLGQEALTMGADAYVSCEHCTAAGLWMQLDGLLKQKSQHLLLLNNQNNDEPLIHQSLYFDRLKHALMSATRHSCCTGILLVSLDDYGALLEEFSDALSEGLLTQLELRLASVMRNSDSLARLHAGVYGVILEGLQDETTVANVARKIQGVFEKDIRVCKSPYHLSVSIGGHLCQPGKQDANAFYQQACVALQHAKQNNRLDLCFYEQALNLKNTARINIEEGLRHAIKNKEFFLQFLPCHTGSGFIISGMSALLRWKHPGSGTVLPSVFMGLLQGSGLIIEVGNWWIDAALSQFSIWAGAGDVNARQQLFIELSEKQLLDENFIRMLTRKMALYNVASEKIVFKVSENMAIDNIEPLRNLSKCIPGICLAVHLGEFTKGYSSLTYLKEIDVDYLSLDGRFVQSSYLNLRASSIAKIIIDITHTMGIEVMATGVNSQSQLDKMQALGCDCVQGDYFSPALYAELWPKYVNKKLF
ncbi:MAG: EAL domain-containing protein [Bermanella sp.]